MSNANTQAGYLTEAEFTTLEALEATRLRLPRALRRSARNLVDKGLAEKDASRPGGTRYRITEDGLAHLRQFDD